MMDINNKKNMKINQFNLPRINDLRGNLSFLENNEHLPFKIKRTYWIYDVPGGATRGGHAYKKLEEVIIALSGSFSLNCYSNKGRSIFLNSIVPTKLYTYQAIHGGS